MKNIVIVGAGSIIFSTTVMNDILATEALNGSSFTLVDTDLAKARRVESYVKKIIAANGL